MAVTADNTSGVAGKKSSIDGLREKVGLLEEGREIWGDGPHHVRPSVSAFFSGRKKELSTLEEIWSNGEVRWSRSSEGWEGRTDNCVR